MEMWLQGHQGPLHLGRHHHWALEHHPVQNLSQVVTEAVPLRGVTVFLRVDSQAL